MPKSNTTFINRNSLGYQKEARCIFKQCLASANRLKQRQPINMKNFICILVSAALLVGCDTLMGKRTETGTVIGLTTQQIRLQVPSISKDYPGAGGPGTFVITIHPPPDTITNPATLKVGSAGTVESDIADWHQVTGQ